MWLALRIIILTLALTGGIFDDHELSSHSLGASEIFSIVTWVLLVSIAWVFLVCCIEASFRSLFCVRKEWLRPSLSCRPFHKNNPLQFWYFMGHFFFWGGVGVAIQWLQGHHNVMGSTLVYLAGGAGLHLGCLISLRFFKKRFVPPLSNSVS